MATTTWIPLGTITLPTSNSAISFNNIPSDYTDLILVGRYTSTVNAQGSFTVNSNSSGYNASFLYGAASTLAASNYTGATGINIAAGFTITSTNGLFFMITLRDYANTNKVKSGEVLSGSARGEGILNLAFAWTQTTAVNKVTVTAPFAAGARFDLYGVH